MILANISNVSWNTSSRLNRITKVEGTYGREDVQNNYRWVLRESAGFYPRPDNYRYMPCS